MTAGPGAVAAAALVLLVALLAQRAAARRIPTYAGPYITYMERMYDCQAGNATALTWTTAIRASPFLHSRPFERQRLSGSVNATEPFDDRWWTRTEASSRSNNQWKQNAFVFPFPAKACSAARANMPDPFRAMFGKEALTRKECVLPPGVYTFSNEPVDWTFPNMPIMPYGFYRISIVSGTLGSRDVKLCLTMEAHFIPKPQ